MLYFTINTLYAKRKTYTKSNTIINTENVFATAGAATLLLTNQKQQKQIQNDGFFEEEQVEGTGLSYQDFQRNQDANKLEANIKNIKQYNIDITNIPDSEPMIDNIFESIENILIKIEDKFEEDKQKSILNLNGYGKVAIKNVSLKLYITQIKEFIIEFLTSYTNNDIIRNAIEYDKILKNLENISLNGKNEIYKAYIDKLINNFQSIYIDIINYKSKKIIFNKDDSDIKSKIDLFNKEQYKIFNTSINKDKIGIPYIKNSNKKE